MTVPSPGDDSPQRWSEALARALAGGACVVRRAVVVEETASTQDHARAADLGVGDALVAWRQTAGRGRLGRAWIDAAGEGVAVTFVLPTGAPESLAARSAVAAARAARRLLTDDACGIKWPNDVVHSGRKLAGVLVECAGPRAFVGVGLNVRQGSFPPPLDASATSLRMLGSAASRLDALLALVAEVDRAFREPDESVYRTYVGLDRLSGRECTFGTPEGSVHGTVLRVDPTHGLEVATPAGTRFLASATTSIVPGPHS